jgi:transposase
LPQCSDLFGARGRSFLRRLELAEPDAFLLSENTELLERIGRQIKEQEKRIGAANQHDALSRRLQSLPGMGVILSAVAATEIDSIERFNSAEKLCAYAGLVPSTYSSGGNTWHGRMLPFCNKWLRWAFIEAAWVAVGCSGYFGALYRQHKARGKQSNTAITIVARRMCRIAWALLREGRD